MGLAVLCAALGIVPTVRTTMLHGGVNWRFGRGRGRGRCRPTMTLRIGPTARSA